MILRVAREKTEKTIHNNKYFRILRWLRDEEEQQQDQKLPKIEFLIVELSRKHTTELILYQIRKYSFMNYV